LKGGYHLQNIDLVKKAIKGDEVAFETLVKSESEKLYKTAFVYVRNKEDALDVLQETVYKAFISIDKVKQPEYFTTWITKILIRTAYDFLRKKKKIVLDERILPSFTAKSRPNIEGNLDLLQAISTLNQNYQTVILLFYYHDLPIREIADAMGIPENTVKTYLRRAKMELKNFLEGVSHFEKRAIT
jgi:RNA polymerase sigma-70 factor (ECF subfamily)